MCSKRSSRKKRGCPCRDEGVKCTERCSCGTKTDNCKNKTQEQGTVASASAGKNAFERHKIAVNIVKPQYKKLGKGNRKVCPSCVVLAIRLIYPANDGVYMGFKRA